jgi:hypothetical protein
VTQRTTRRARLDRLGRRAILEEATPALGEDDSGVVALAPLSMRPLAGDRKEVPLSRPDGDSEGGPRRGRVAVTAPEDHSRSEAMRKTQLFASVAALLAATAAASANTIETSLFPVHEAGLWAPPSNACGFPIYKQTDGTFKETDYFNNDGLLYKAIITSFGGPVRLTLTNPVTGKSATAEQGLVIIDTFASDGSITSDTSVGARYNFVAPGVGAILQVVGRLVLDSDGNRTLAAGPKDFADQNTAAFCAYMADP